MFQRFIAISLIFFTLAASFSRLFVFAGFELNQKYIAEKLCENKAKPWMHCNGKCYFMKKIKQAEEKEKSGERENQKNGFQMAAIFTQPSKINFHTVVLQVMQPREQLLNLPGNLAAIFQPPRTA